MDGVTQRAIAGGSDEESASRMTEATATDTAGWKTDRVGIRRADNGGFIVDCSRSKPGKGGNYESKDYAFSTLDQVTDVLTTEFGGTAAESSEASEVAGDDEATEA